MLYVSTRNPQAAYTAQQTMSRPTADDGGLFVPIYLSAYVRDDLHRLMGAPFPSVVCAVLNRFFPVRPCGAMPDVSNLELPEPIAIRQNVVVAPVWDKPSGSLSGLVRQLLDAMGVQVSGGQTWPVLAIHVAVLTGLYGKLCCEGLVRPGEQIDLVVSAADFLLPVAAVYARCLGFPLGTCICVCNENTLPWELLHRGEVRFDGTGPTEKVGERREPINLERLIFHRLGWEVAADYACALRQGESFTLTAEQRHDLRQDMSVSVVGSRRAMSMIPRVYRDMSCLFSPHSAMLYSGLLDHRANGGKPLKTVLIAEESPMRWGEYVLKAMNIPVESVTGQIAALETRAVKCRKGS